MTSVGAFLDPALEPMCISAPRVTATSTQPPPRRLYYISVENHDNHRNLHYGIRLSPDHRHENLHHGITHHYDVEVYGGPAQCVVRHDNA